jgi:hypothetical protein
VTTGGSPLRELLCKFSEGAFFVSLSKRDQNGMPAPPSS